MLQEVIAYFHKHLTNTFGCDNSIPGKLQLRGGRHVAVREPRAYWHDMMATFSLRHAWFGVESCLLTTTIQVVKVEEKKSCVSCACALQMTCNSDLWFSSSVGVRESAHDKSKFSQEAYISRVAGNEFHSLPEIYTQDPVRTNSVGRRCLLFKPSALSSACMKLQLSIRSPCPGPSNAIFSIHLPCRCLVFIIHLVRNHIFGRVDNFLGRSFD